MTTEPIVYIFLRKDLERFNPMYPAIQLGHATYALGYQNGFGRGASGIYNDGSLREPTFCVFGVDDETAFHSVWNWIEDADFPFQAFFEPDHDTGHTAIAVGPIHTQEDRDRFKRYKLYQPSTFFEKLKFSLARRLNNSQRNERTHISSILKG